MQQNENDTLFQNGSVWVKADFHLHTKADKEFTYKCEDNHFVKNYIIKLQEQKIRVGVITNHNKFDRNEYNALAKLARKNEILLLPGLELSVNDGANGIHVLVVFSKQWLEGGYDYINPFITNMFPGKSEAEYQHENGRSDKNILQVVEELEKVNRDYFLIQIHACRYSNETVTLTSGSLTPQLFSKRLLILWRVVKTHSINVKRFIRYGSLGVNRNHRT